MTVYTTMLDQIAHTALNVFVIHIKELIDSSSHRTESFTFS